MEFPFSLFLLILFSLPKCSISINSDLIHQSCQKVAKTDPNLSYKFCVDALESDPKSENATSIEDLALVSIDLTISNATKIRSFVSKILKGEKPPVLADPRARLCLKDCLQIYSDAIYDLHKARQNFRARDFASVGVEISAAMDAPSTCEDGFGEMKGRPVSPLTLVNQAFFQWTAISLSFSIMSDPSNNNNNNI